jgi:hypothetical protein
MFFGSSRTPYVPGKTQDDKVAAEAAPASNVDMEVGNPSSWDEPPGAYSVSHGQQWGSAHRGWLAPSLSLIQTNVVELYKGGRS